MLVVYLFWCSCIVCSLLLVCAVLKTLHSAKSILNEEECRSVGEAGDRWDDGLAVILATKPPGVVEETLDVLEEYKGQGWYHLTAERIQSKRCSRPHLSTPCLDCGESCLQHQASLATPVPPTFSSDCALTHIVDLWY